MWQLLTLGILLALMIGLEEFNLVPLEAYLGQATPFTPKSLAATGFIILAAFTTGELFKRFKIPALLGYIAAGIIFGPQLVQILYHLVQQHWPEFTELIYHDHAPIALFSEQVIKDLALINVLTIGVIGTMGGGELKIGDIRESWKLILSTIGLMVLTAIPLTIAVVMGLQYLPFDLTSFLDEVTAPSRLGAALLFGILATAMSPAATLAIIQETRARGKFTSLALGVVVVADLTLVALFLVGFNISRLLVAPEGFSFGKLVEALPGIGMEFGWALVIGIVTGFVFILYMRYIRKEMMLFTVGVIFTASFISQELHAETLLAFLTAGFIVQNFSRHGHDLIHELEKISSPVFIVYFMTQAAKLDIMGVVAYLPLTLILATVRALSYYGSARFATRRLHSPERTQRWLWLSFLSRGGVDLVLADMVSKAVTETGDPLFSWGADFQTVVMATVVVHIVVGPPLLKVALGKAGETEDARKSAASEGEKKKGGGEGSVESVASTEHEFPMPQLQDRMLNARLQDLREQLIALHRLHIAQPLEQQRSTLEESVSQIQKDIEDNLSKLSNLLANQERYEDETALIRAIEALYTQARRKLQPSIQLWEKFNPMVMDARTAEAIILEVQNMERFDNQFVVDLDPDLYDPSQSDRPYVRMLRRLRALQRLIVGPMRRTIPLGKLWRYYIELSIPRNMVRAAEATAPSHERFWFEFGRYLRRFDQLFDQVLHELRTPAGVPELGDEQEPGTDEEDVGGSSDQLPVADAAPSAAGAPDHEPPQEEEGDEDPFALTPIAHGLDPTHPPRQRAMAFLEEARTRHSENAAAIHEALSSWLTRTKRGYSWSLQSAYASFLDAVKTAGTMELPAPAYRTSTKFDDALRAEVMLRNRLTREREVVSAYIGWIVVDHQLSLFAAWFGNYQQRILETLRTTFEEQYLRQLRILERRSREQAAHLENDETVRELEWREWQRMEFQPTVRSIRRTLERALTSFGQGVVSRRLIDALEYRVASLSERLPLSLQDPDLPPPESSSLDTIQLSVRQWFSNRLVSEIALRYIEFNERAERLVRRNLVGVESFQQLLREPLTSEQEEGGAAVSPTATPVEEQPSHRELMLERLRRAERAAHHLSDVLIQDLRELESWTLVETTKLLELSLAPFEEHQLNEIERSLTRHSTDEERYASSSMLGRAALPLLRWSRGIYSLLAPIYEEFVDDFQHLLSDEPHRPERADVRRRLKHEEQQRELELPTIYKRLFNPVPLDLPEFYVERPALESECLEAIAQWGRGHQNAILIHGDRGIGKRTFIHNLVPIKVYDLGPVFQQTPIQTINLSEELRTEAELCLAFATIFDNDPPQTLEALSRRLRASPQRQVIIVENATKCYSRTHDGVDLCKRFLQTLTHTSDKVLWILLMDTPAATLLDTMLDLFAYFTHAFEVGPLGEEELEAMIYNRHRVSGFDLHYGVPQLRLLQRSRHPFAASEARRNPRRDFFRRLSVLSQGNPLQALLFWLEAAQLAPVGDTQIHVMPLPEQELTLLAPLTLNKRLILATLLQHGALLATQLADILCISKEEVQIELEHLTRLGFLETLTGSLQSYHVRDVAVVQLTNELRHTNLI